MILKSVMQYFLLLVVCCSGSLNAAAATAAPKQLNITAIDSFGTASREEQEAFFESVKSLSGIPESIKIPDSTDDSATFATKAKAALTEIDRYLKDPESANQGWARQVAAKLTAKYKFSALLSNMGERISNLEKRLASLASPNTNAGSSAR